MVEITKDVLDELEVCFNDYKDKEKKFNKEQEWLYKLRYYLKRFQKYGEYKVKEDRCCITSLDKLDLRIVYRKTAEHFWLNGNDVSMKELCEMIHIAKKNVRVYNHDWDIARKVWQEKVKIIGEKSKYSEEEIINTIYGIRETVEIASAKKRRIAELEVLLETAKKDLEESNKTIEKYIK